MTFLPVALHHTQTPITSTDRCHTLSARGAAVAYPVAVSQNQRGELRTADTMPALSNGGGKPGQGYPAVLTPELVVRRLTPVECERLQGWPDNWTAYTADGTEIADSHRYRMAGNGISAPVAQWVAEQINRAEVAR